jgi:hypothetical protein
MHCAFCPQTVCCAIVASDSQNIALSFFHGSCALKKLWGMTKNDSVFSPLHKMIDKIMFFSVKVLIFLLICSIIENVEKGVCGKEDSALVSAISSPFLI